MSQLSPHATGVGKEGKSMLRRWFRGLVVAAVVFVLLPFGVEGPGRFRPSLTR